MYWARWAVNWIQEYRINFGLFWESAKAIKSVRGFLYYKIYNIEIHGWVLLWPLFLPQGDYIDFTIGTVFGLSTMAAAALGNTISDLAGIGSAWYVENAAEKIGVKAPPLTNAQLESSKARWSANAVSNNAI